MSTVNIRGQFLRGRGQMPWGRDRGQKEWGRGRMIWPRGLNILGSDREHSSQLWWATTKRVCLAVFASVRKHISQQLHNGRVAVSLSRLDITNSSWRVCCRGLVRRGQQISIDKPSFCCRATCGLRKFWPDCREVLHTCSVVIITPIKQAFSVWAETHEWKMSPLPKRQMRNASDAWRVKL